MSAPFYAYVQHLFVNNARWQQIRRAEWSDVLFDRAGVLGQASLSAYGVKSVG